MEATQFSTFLPVSCRSLRQQRELDLVAHPKVPYIPFVDAELSVCLQIYQIQRLWRYEIHWDHRMHLYMCVCVEIGCKSCYSICQYIIF